MGRGLEDYDELTLSTLGNGALEEKFQAELARVLANINDPNANDGKREIALKITIIPKGSRGEADMELASSCKLQADAPYASGAYLGRQGAQLKIWEHNPEQLRFPAEGDHIGEVPKTTIGGLDE